MLGVIKDMGCVQLLPGCKVNSAHTALLDIDPHVGPGGKDLYFLYKGLHLSSCGIISDENNVISEGQKVAVDS